MTASKTCTECGVEKPLEEFHRNRRAKNGHINQCKACVRPKNAAWNRKNKKRHAETTRAYRERHPERMRAMRRAANKKSREKTRARRLVNRAIAAGTLIRPETCDGCDGPGPIEAHHDDYSKPLEVRWLCRTCHGKTWRVHDEENPDAR